MPFHDRFRSMHAHVIAWLILPLAVILAFMIVAGTITYQNSLQSLASERHQQLANLAAVSISQEIEGYARDLASLQSQPGLLDPSPAARQAALHAQADRLAPFTGGVALFGVSGELLAVTPGSSLALLVDPNHLAALELPPAAALEPTFSDVVTVEGGRHLILISVPVGSQQARLVGGLDLSTAPLSTPLERLTNGASRIAFLVDRRGISISHPDPAQIGQDFSDRPYFGYTASGNFGGKLWISPQGERFLGAEALVTPTGWSLIIKESWDVVFEPARWYQLTFLGIGLFGLALIFALAWAGTWRLAVPIQNLAGRARLLAEGQNVPPLPDSNIQEINHLKDAFEEMVRQISSYRTGLRRYVGAITQSQEEERLRISRELHDETIQDLLAVYRHMEMYIESEPDPARKEQLARLHKMVGQTADGVRMISQDLRPMVLDDLGFVPAVKMLVRATHQGKGAIPLAQIEITGEVAPLSPEQDLALYRIVQEGLSNVRKHAQATGVQVKLEYCPQEVRLMIRDDGKGFTIPPSLTELVQVGSLGLMGIQERVWSVGGALSIQSKLGQGTQVSVTIPREKPGPRLAG